jgi:membrane associated rhomboid family serine protease
LKGCALNARKKKMNGGDTQGEQGSANVPLGVFLTFLVCCGLQVGQYAFGWSLGEFVLSPGEVWFNHCFSRLISGAFFHVGLMHFGFNMLSLMTLGPNVEKLMGSFRFVLYMCVCVFLSNIIYVLVCALLANVNNPSWWNYNSVGYSGCLFAFAAIESFLSPLPM